LNIISNFNYTCFSFSGHVQLSTCAWLFLFVVTEWFLKFSNSLQMTETRVHFSLTVNFFFYPNWSSSKIHFVFTAQSKSVSKFKLIFRGIKAVCLPRLVNKRWKMWKCLLLKKKVCDWYQSWAQRKKKVKISSWKLKTIPRQKLFDNFTTISHFLCRFFVMFLVFSHFHHKLFVRFFFVLSALNKYSFCLVLG
jgi:hypothetical protein